MDTNKKRSAMKKVGLIAGSIAIGSCVSLHANTQSAVNNNKIDTKQNTDIVNSNNNLENSPTSDFDLTAYSQHTNYGAHINYGQYIREGGYSQYTNYNQYTDYNQYGKYAD